MPFIQKKLQNEGAYIESLESWNGVAWEDNNLHLNILETHEKAWTKHQICECKLHTNSEVFL